MMRVFQMDTEPTKKGSQWPKLEQSEDQNRVVLDNGRNLSSPKDMCRGSTIIMEEKNNN